MREKCSVPELEMDSVPKQRPQSGLTFDYFSVVRVKSRADPASIDGEKVPGARDGRMSYHENNWWSYN